MGSNPGHRGGKPATDIPTQDNTIRKWRERHTSRGQNLPQQRAYVRKTTREHPDRYIIQIQRNGYQTRSLGQVADASNRGVKKI
jgi:hypothetical protein